MQFEENLLICTYCFLLCFIFVNQEKSLFCFFFTLRIQYIIVNKKEIRYRRRQENLEKRNNGENNNLGLESAISQKNKCRNRSRKWKTYKLSVNVSLRTNPQIVDLYSAISKYFLLCCLGVISYRMQVELVQCLYS